MSQSVFEDAPAPYGFKASDIGAYFYKIRDDTVRPRQFLGADNADGIEAILLEREGHSLHEIIDGDEPLRPIIDFDLSQEVLDTIEPKLTRKEIGNLLYRAFIETCHEIFPEWNDKTLTIASSSDAKKMSLHISTTGMRLPNIAKVSVFTELFREKLPVGLQKKGIIDNIANVGPSKSFSLRMLGSPKIDKETGSHKRVKKVMYPKDGSIFDFMIRPPNDESEVVDSPLLKVPETEVKRSNDTVPEVSTNGEATQADFDFVESLLEENCIEGYTLSFPSENIPDLFPLTRNSPSQCPLCDREHTSDNAYIIRKNKSFRFYCHRANHERKPGTRNPSKKLTINETALNREKKLPSPVKLEQSRISNPKDRFVWWDLIRMCTTGKKFSRTEVYEAIQSTVAYIQKKIPIWILKHKDSENGLYFDMGAELKLAKFEIKIIEYGGESVKLKTLIDQAVIKGLIVYEDYDFLPYPISVSQPDSDFFNLFLGFLAKPATKVNKEIMDPILWHVLNVICSGDEKLNEYIWNWWAYLVQKPEKKPRTILVLKSTLQQCEKNIITDFIGDKVLGEHLHYAGSDLEKMLERFNSVIQARKLIVMNETGMSSGEWHRFNGHLKSLITEGKVSIERKGLETKRLKDFAGYMVTSNQDAPLKIDIGDSREILDHPDAPGVVIKYLLTCDLSNWNPQEIPATKMKSDIMRDQLPNSNRFIIDYIASWAEDKVSKPSCTSLYQNYLEWCDENGEKPFSDTKLRESGLDDIEEFSDIPQEDLPASEAIIIPTFNVLGIIPRKTAPSQPEKSTPPRDKKAEPPIASTSGTSETSKTSELSKPAVINKSEPSSDILDNTEPKAESKPPQNDEPINDESKQNVVEASCKAPPSPTILSSRAQREERLRKRAVELGEDLDAFVTITEKDGLDSIVFRDRMETDSRMCGYAKDEKEDPNEYMDMTVRERLIGEEIIRREFEDDGITSSWLDTDEEWQKNISILQENGMLW
ncbi:highly derived D5-like helicase-primase [Rhizophagus clarus]|uniref:Highly derived D5-like helicase-primase n=1 Tax=Rhizophagus clarus TaxID=94130 RepID=A0A8H3LCJ3_9GLOM|nr:highly derived D5-like helicase-primase [Rhizophagus clarus]